MSIVAAVQLGGAAGGNRVADAASALLYRVRLPRLSGKTLGDESVASTEVQSSVMGRTLQDLYREAAELSESERAELAGLLLESLESEPEVDVEVAWAEEIERRVREIDAGTVKTIPWEQVRAQMHARLGEKR